VSAKRSPARSATICAGSGRNCDNVLLHLPPEVIAEAGLPYEGLRDPNGITLALDGINVAASVVTLATLRLNLVRAVGRSNDLTTLCDL
jgi:hypothetical protein